MKLNESIMKLRNAGYIVESKGGLTVADIKAWMKEEEVDYGVRFGRNIVIIPPAYDGDPFSGKLTLNADGTWKFKLIDNDEGTSQIISRSIDSINDLEVAWNEFQENVT